MFRQYIQCETDHREQYGKEYRNTFIDLGNLYDSILRKNYVKIYEKDDYQRSVDQYNIENVLEDKGPNKNRQQTHGHNQCNKKIKQGCCLSPMFLMYTYEG